MAREVLSKVFRLIFFHVPNYSGSEVTLIFTVATQTSRQNWNMCTTFLKLVKNSKFDLKSGTLRLCFFFSWWNVFKCKVVNPKAVANLNMKHQGFN